VISADEAAPTGWASAAGGTTGGAGAAPDSIYTVTTRAELKAALANNGAPAEPKIIYIDGVINGNEAPDGRVMTEQDYAPGYDIDKYMSCFINGGTQWSDQAFDYCKDMRHLRQNGSNAMKRLIEVNVPSNTTLLGVGANSGFVGANLVFHNVSNVIMRNLSVESPVSYFTSWSPDDGDGAWNARFDTISSVTSDHLWFDHILATDGRFPDSDAPVGFRGEPVIRHDGLLDLKDGTDYVTVSRSQFRNHDKTNLLGSGDEHADTDGGRLRVTYIANLFENTQERSPRVRFGEVHLVNNYYVGSTDNPQYPMISSDLGGTHYFIGIGYESKIYSENNVFDYSGPGASPAIIAYNYNGYQFFDRGSWYNGSPIDVNDIALKSFEDNKSATLAAAEQAGTPAPDWTEHTFTTDVGWTPSEVYSYKAFTSPAAVKNQVLNFSGPGVITVKAPH
jgi:pectate lyase